MGGATSPGFTVKAAQPNVVVVGGTQNQPTTGVNPYKERYVYIPQAGGRGVWKGGGVTTSLGNRQGGATKRFVGGRDTESAYYGR